MSSSLLATTPSRSSMFAFKCIIGASLTRLDINATSRTNIVKQLFVSKQGDTHYVCLRLRNAISRTQFARMLELIESNMRTTPGSHRNHLRRPPGVSEWRDAVFMGEELRDGEGHVIRQTLKRHMEDTNPHYSESHSTTTRHVTHMLRDSIRPNPNAPRRSSSSNAPVVVPPAPVAASYLSMSGDSGVTIALSNNNDPPPHFDNNDEQQQPGPSSSSLLFSPARVDADGQPNMVEPAMEMAAMVSEIVRTVFQVGPDFNLQRRFDNIDTRIAELASIARQTHREVSRN